MFTLHTAGCAAVYAAWTLVAVALLGVSAAEAGPTVAMIRSDAPSLPAPIGASEPLDYHRHVLPMVQRVLVQGGLRRIIDAAQPGDDGVVDVVCKVNIVHADHIQGDVTDWRVVKAIFETVHAWRPEARLTIAEGGVWFPPERTDLIALAPHIEVGDGFETAGYRALLRDPDLAAANMRIVDLNYDATIELTPPGGGLIAATYHMPRTIIDAEIFIDVPVMKITGAVGMTVAMKNLIGIAPGMVYGWSKSTGWPPDSGKTGLWHTARTLDETLVDLVGIAGVDFTVVDAIMCMERARIHAAGGQQLRRNIVFAGADIVAVDAVATRLMGMNPADMEYLQLAQHRGLGVADIDRIDLIGDLQRLSTRFHKYLFEWDDYGHYGMGQRTWLLLGPVPTDDTLTTVDPGMTPRPGEEDWSSPVYFHDDKIDLDRYFGDPIHCAVYAYAEFDAPRDEAAQLWVGSDEGLTVWIDGVEVYNFTGRRRHRLPNDRVEVALTKGPHRVMVRARQRRGDFDFSLKLCEMEQDPRYDGNHVFGLTWNVPGQSTHEVAEVLVIGDNRSSRAQWYEAHEIDTTLANRVFLKTILPWYSGASWVHLEAPRMWGDEMELEATLDGNHLRILTGNVSAFRLEPKGPLETPAAALDLIVDGVRIGTLTQGRWRVAIDGHGDWSMTSAAPLDWDERSIIGTAATPLSRHPRRDESDSPLGNWYCDAFLVATGADVALQNNGGIRGNLEQGPISIRDIFRINFPNYLITFPLTGSELLQVLEFDHRDGRERPLQVGGIEYVIDRARPEGQRVVTSNIDAQRSYTIATQAYLGDRAQRFFGRNIVTTDSGVQTVDAQIRLVMQQGLVRPPATGRIRLTPNGRGR